MTDDTMGEITQGYPSQGPSSSASTSEEGYLNSLRRNAGNLSTEEQITAAFEFHCSFRFIHANSDAKKAWRKFLTTDPATSLDIEQLLQWEFHLLRLLGRTSHYFVGKDTTLDLKTLRVLVFAAESWMYLRIKNTRDNSNKPVLSASQEFKDYLVEIKGQEKYTNWDTACLESIFSGLLQVIDALEASSWVVKKAASSVAMSEYLLGKPHLKPSEEVGHPVGQPRIRSNSSNLQPNSPPSPEPPSATSSTTNSKDETTRYPDNMLGREATQNNPPTILDDMPMPRPNHIADPKYFAEADNGKRLLTEMDRMTTYIASQGSRVPHSIIHMINSFREQQLRQSNALNEEIAIAHAAGIKLERARADFRQKLNYMESYCQLIKANWDAVSNFNSAKNVQELCRNGLETSEKLSQCLAKEEAAMKQFKDVRCEWHGQLDENLSDLMDLCNDHNINFPAHE